MENWDPRKEDFNDQNYSTVRGGPVSNYVRQPQSTSLRQAFALYIKNIPGQMTKRDLGNHLTQPGINILDIIFLPAKEGFKSKVAIVKVENANQGIQIIDHYNAKPPLCLHVAKALSQNPNTNGNEGVNSNVNDLVGGFQPVKPTPLQNPAEIHNKNLRRPNKMCGYYATAENVVNGGPESTKRIQNSSLAHENNTNNMLDLQATDSTVLRPKAPLGRINDLLQNSTESSIKTATLSVESVKANLEERFNDMKINYVECNPRADSQCAVSSVQVERKVSASSSTCSTESKTKSKKMMTCIYCGEKGSLRCSICYAFYCSQICQRDHWYIHMEKCRPLPKLVTDSSRDVIDEQFRKREVPSSRNSVNDAIDVDEHSTAASSTSRHASQVQEYIQKPATAKSIVVNSSYRTNGTLELNAATKVQPQNNRFHFNKLKHYPIEINKTYKVEPVYLDKHLFVRILSEEVENEMRNFTIKLKSFFEGVSDGRVTDLCAGQLYCIYDESDRNYYRARVLQVKGSTILSQYVDYGNISKVDVSNARIFDSTFLDMPVACIQLENLRSFDGTNSVKQVIDTWYTLAMTVYTDNPLAVDLKDELGIILVTSKKIEAQTEIVNGIVEPESVRSKLSLKSTSPVKPQQQELYKIKQQQSPQTNNVTASKIQQHQSLQTNNVTASNIQQQSNVTVSKIRQQQSPQESSVAVSKIQQQQSSQEINITASEIQQQQSSQEINISASQIQQSPPQTNVSASRTQTPRQETVTFQTPSQQAGSVASSGVSNTPSEIYSKDFGDSDSLSLPIGENVQVFVLYNNELPLIHVVPEANIDMLEKLQVISDQMQEHCNTKSNKSYKPEENEMVLACFDKDEQWYRAAVLEISETSAQVIFVDYGNVEMVTFPYICPMLKKFMELPILSVMCSIIDLPEQMSEAERQAAMEIATESLTINVQSCEQLVYYISIPSLLQARRASSK